MSQILNAALFMGISPWMYAYLGKIQIPAFLFGAGIVMMWPAILRLSREMCCE
jgi:hypothetical protein